MSCYDRCRNLLTQTMLHGPQHDETYLRKYSVCVSNYPLAQEKELDQLVIDEWRGVSRGAADIICDAAGGVCPWRVVDGTNTAHWNISADAAVLVVCLAWE